MSLQRRQNIEIQLLSQNNLMIILSVDQVLQMCDDAALNTKTVIKAKKLDCRATVCNVSRETERIKDATEQQVQVIICLLCPPKELWVCSPKLQKKKGQLSLVFCFNSIDL